jgi:hypothetical protein
MLILPLVLTAAAAAASGDQSYVEVSVTGEMAAEDPSPSASVYGFGHGEAGITVFPRAVVDDDSPLSLQPFLQRLSTINLGAGGGATVPAQQSVVPPNQRVHATAYGDADVYLNRVLAIAAGMSLNWYEDTMPTVTMAGIVSGGVLQLRPFASVGLRFADLRVNFGWLVSATRAIGGDWLDPFYGSVFVDGKLVVARRVAVNLGVTVLRGGATTSAGAAFYFGRRFDLFASMFGGLSEEPGNLGIGQRRVVSIGGSLGITAWQSRFFGGSLSYQPSLIRYPDLSRTQHLFVLSFFSRPR